MDDGQSMTTAQFLAVDYQFDRFPTGILKIKGYSIICTLIWLRLFATSFVRMTLYRSQIRCISRLGIPERINMSNFLEIPDYQKFSWKKIRKKYMFSIRLQINDVIG